MNEINQSKEKCVPRFLESNRINRCLEQDVEYGKKDHDFYDQEGELDMMFPNRYDDDFDEDSISWDSIFGEN